MKAAEVTAKRELSSEASDDRADHSSPTVAILIPCYNEEVAIGKVVSDFREALPNALVYVYDNNSKDGTAEVASRAGAIVRREPMQGKGNVLRRMFADIDADIYVLVDGDDTYHADSAPKMVEMLVSECLDMVNSARSLVTEDAHRSGHRFGNKLLTNIVRFIFGDGVRDMLSGYRVFSRRFVKSFPALSAGFETETELTIHALELRMPISEVATPYKKRPEGSESKLSTIRDGIRILTTILRLVKEERPLPFFFLLFLIMSICSMGLAWPIFIEYLNSGQVPRFPTAVLSTGMMLLAFILLGVGLTLDTVTRGRRELKRLHYLSIAAPSRPHAASSVEAAGAVDERTVREGA